MTMTTARRLLLLATAVVMATAVVLTFAGSPATARPAAPVARAPQATYDTFVRTWTGHTRSLTIRRDHVGRELVYSGCCEKVADLKLHLSKPRGTTRRGSILARVTKVRYWDAGLGARPHRGDAVRVTLRRGELFEPIVGTNYCNAAAGRRGVCGA